MKRRIPLLLANSRTGRMTCTICGNPFPCTHTRGNAALLVDEAVTGPAHRVDAQSLLRGPGNSHPQPWRNEVIARVRQHRARRRGRANPDAMELDFPAPELPTEEAWPAWEASKNRTAMNAQDDPEPQTQAGPPPHVPPKIIRFPVPPFSRFPATEQQLEQEADAAEATRILYAEPEAGDSDAKPALVAPPAEQMELHCFDDIHLDSDVHKPLEIMEPVPQPAPLGRRAIASAADLGIVLLAFLAFKFTFTHVAEDEPASKAALLCAIAVAGALWMLYQYLFLVHGDRTPGMVLTDLELSTFAGDPVTRKDRRLRALAGAVSAFSLGLGFAWALVDEDQLGWHDRMTGTVVRDSTQPAEQF